MVLSDTEVYEKYSAELIRFAAALAGPSGAEDLLATAWLSALASPRWKTVTNKRAYLYRSVANTAHKTRRSTQRRLSREAQAARPIDGLSSPTDRDVIAALCRLTLRQRAILYLTYWLDLPAAEVAPLVCVSKRSVERELAAARRRMKELMT